MAESNDEAQNSKAEDGAGEAGSGRASLTAQELTEAALSAIADLTRYEPEAVTGLEWDGQAWQASVDVLELERIPNTTDVLATYDVQLDDEGTLLGYKRRRRFIRGQAEIGE
jgi:Gas vesicle synthesis protein GvpO